MTQLLQHDRHVQVLADAAREVAESHKTGRERFPRHLTGIPHGVDESWEHTDEPTERRRDPWMR